MDKKLFIKEIKKTFLNFNATEKKYSKIWLTEVDYGGLYYSDKCVLNVQMENHIDIYSYEIDFLVDFLSENLPPEINILIDHVKVYNDTDFVRIGREDIVLFDEALYDAA